MGHGAKGGAVGIGGAKGVGVADGFSKGLATAVGRAIGLVAKALGHSNSPQTSKGGKGTTHGRGFGFGYASIGHPGHNALSGRSSQSQNASHKGGTPDGRSFSNHTHAEHSLAQDHVAHTSKADPAEQVNDQDPGKAKGPVDSLPSNREPPADRSVTLNPSLDNDVAVGPQPNQELRAESSHTLNPGTIALGPFLTQLPQLSHDPQADSSQALNPGTIRSDPDEIIALQLHMIHSELDDNVMRVKRASMDLTVPDADDSPVAKFPNLIGLQDWTAVTTSPVLDDDDEIGWRLVPFFGLVLVFFVTKAFSRQGDTSCLPAGYDQTTSKSPASASGPLLSLLLLQSEKDALGSPQPDAPPIVKIPDRAILAKAGQQTQDLLRSGTVRRRLACGSQPEEADRLVRVL
jgi:hypothetical protein